MMDLTARRAERTDARLLWRWANDPETRRRSFGKATIPYADHLTWLAAKLASDASAIWIFRDGPEPVGQVRVDLADGVAEVSLVVAPEHRGRGYGKSMLASALPLLRRDFAPHHRVRALVLDDNVASLRLFTAGGFRVVGPARRADGQQATVLELQPSGKGEAGASRLKVVGAIQARTGSTRLPGKVLLPIAGRSAIERIAGRMAACRELDAIVVSTSVEPRDDALEQLATRIGLACVRGSEADLVERLGRTARVTGADALVRITADCPLTDPALIDRTVVAWRDSGGRLDYVSNVFPATFPDGLDVEVLSRQVLERLGGEITDPFFRESLTAYIRERPGAFEILNVEHCSDLSHLRWTLDYPEDLRFVEAVYTALGERAVFGMAEILDLVERHPELRDLNRHREDTVTLRGIRGATYHAALSKHQAQRP
jgi:spore coat polysaccharide biosynthesis protein SpsF